MNSGFSFWARIFQHRRNFYLITFLFYVVVVLCITLFPINFSPTNGVQWLSPGSGLYFNGNGIAYSKQSLDDYALSCEQAISIEINFRERRGSNNSGPRELLSLYDGTESPPLLIGIYGGQVFLYSRFECNSKQQWYDQFRPNNNISKGKEYYITVVYGEKRKALYCNGKLVKEQAAHYPSAEFEALRGHMIVGSSPFCKYGWMGEIRGIALYDCALSSSDVLNHYKIFINNGMSSLAGLRGLCGLYDFHAHNGNIVQNMAGSVPALYIPDKYTPVRKTIMHEQRLDFHMDQDWIYDLILNTFLFLPSGFLFSGFFNYITSKSHLILFFVCIACTGISFGIEIAQIFIPSRYPSYYDVVSNVLGAATGSSVYLSLSRRLNSLVP